jgi:outer membrane protein assembly factor BamA
MRTGRSVSGHARFWLLIIGLCHLPCLQAQMAGISPGVIGLPISTILVTGNTKTQERWVLEWADIEPGDILTRQKLLRARQELLDTDLFRTVSMQAERYENGELTLHIILEERRYWLLLPRLSRNADGDVKFGLRLRVYNMQGADRSLQVLAQQEEEEDGDDSRELRLSYRMPLYDSPYELSWGLSHEVENNTEEGFENVETVSQVAMAISRDIDIESLSYPLTISGGVSFLDRDLREPYPDSIAAREAGNFNQLGVEFTLDDLHSERYRRFGSYYSIAFARGFDWLGSDYDSDIVQFETIHLIRLNRYDNFNFRVVIDAANDSPFDYPAFSIGGGTSIRGLESVEDRGNARLFANFEYVFAYRRSPGLRHTLFLDVGNIYDEWHYIDLKDLHYTLGTGFRWKIEAFVRTDLFLDYGYDFEENEGKLYGGTSLPF